MADRDLSRTTHARYVSRMKKQRTQQQQFGDWLRQRLIAKGYNMAPRGGGQGRFAADAGIPPASLSRLLRGEGVPDIRTLIQLADALGEPLPDILVRSGAVPAEQLAGVQHPARERPITPEEAAAELGITDPTRVAAFVTMVDAFRADEDEDPPRRARK